MGKQKANDLRINDFLKTIGQSFKTVDPAIFWPLNGAQIDAYFSDTQSIEIYDKIYTLKKRGLSNKEIAKLFRQPVILRYFLSHFATISLKVCDVLKIRPFSPKERIDFTLLLFDILEEMVQGDIFCLRGTNQIYSPKEISKISNKSRFKSAVQDKRSVNNLIVSLFHLCNTLYYDVFIGAGLEIHGPYNTEEIFGKKTFLIIRDYFDLNPEIVWPQTVKQTPWAKIRMMLIYKDTDWRINFFNQPYSKRGIGQYLEYFLVEVDGVETNNIGEIEKIDSLAEKITIKQTRLINSFCPLKQARKGAEIFYYMLREFYTYFDQKPEPSLAVNLVFKKYGDKFIKQFALKKNHPISYYLKLFDPRNNFIGE